MKYLLFALLIPATINAQVYSTKDEAKAAIKGGAYTTSSGWTIKEGDTIQLGKGTMPDKRFVYISQVPDLLSPINSDWSQMKMPFRFNGKKAVLGNIGLMGSKKTGFYIAGILKVGEMVKYQVEFDNAIEAGELIPPAQYAVKKNGADGKPATSLADELKKLKELLDSGAISQAEYDALKKKLIDAQ